MQPLLNGYNAFITGAGSGIGKSTALNFARQGVAGLAIADINKESLEAVAATLAKECSHVKVISLVLDVTDAAQVKQGLSQSVKAFGRLDVAVNNAGSSGKNQPTHTLAKEDWQRVVDLNVNSVFYCQKEELAIMKKQKDLGPRRGRGVIVNTSSIAGLRGLTIPIYQSAYVASKHAVVGLTKADAVHYSSYNIRINAICPGYVDTPLVVTDTPGIEEHLQFLKSSAPMNRLISPDEVADGIVFMASQMSSAMQGSTLVVDLGSNSAAGAVIMPSKI